ncbi:hypothetical protein V7968_22175 [Nocardia vulneris]
MNKHFDPISFDIPARGLCGECEEIGHFVTRPIANFGYPSIQFGIAASGHDEIQHGRVAVGVVEHGGYRRAQCGQQIAALTAFGDGRADAHTEFIGGILEDAKIKLGFRAGQVIHDRTRYPGGSDDILHRRFPVALFGEQLGRNRQYLLVPDCTRDLSLRVARRFM